MLYELLYTSAAVKDMLPEELLFLLNQARKKNARLNVTGLLLYDDLEFMQLIEGEREVIRALWKEIRLDNRHTSARVIFEGPIEKRGFSEWKMGFRHLGDVDSQTLASFPELLKEGFTSERVAERPSVARELMVHIAGFLFDA